MSLPHLWRPLATSAITVCFLASTTCAKKNGPGAPGPHVTRLVEYDILCAPLDDTWTSAYAGAPSVEERRALSAALLAVKARTLANGGASAPSAATTAPGDGQATSGGVVSYRPNSAAIRQDSGHQQGDDGRGSGAQGLRSGKAATLTPRLYSGEGVTATPTSLPHFGQAATEESRLSSSGYAASGAATRHAGGSPALGNIGTKPAHGTNGGAHDLGSQGVGSGGEYFYSETGWLISGEGEGLEGASAAALPGAVEGQHDSEGDVLFCTSDADCNDSIACTTDLCDPATGQCVHVGECCFHYHECADEDPCTIDICDPATNKCTYEPVDCADSDACTEDWCEPFVGCQHEPLANCPQSCAVSADCNDGNYCTEDRCDLPEHVCEYVKVNCDDGNPCTQDFCTPEEGCIHEEIAGCQYCESDADCPLPLDNYCVHSTCDPNENKCIYEQTYCDDGDECTADFCVPETGKCETDWICCEDDTDCDPGNLCTLGKCVKGKCELTPISCDDKDPCTFDSCDSDVGCIHEKILKCGASPSRKH